MPLGALIRTMMKAIAFRLLSVLPMLAFMAACADEAAPQAQARTEAAASVAADVPLGRGFDFYVLALSWSPAYCRIKGADANRKQCAEGRDLGFIVHGLWPQFEAGYPEFCPTRDPDRVPSQLGLSYSDIVPTMGLIGHQWRKHGSCSGLSQTDYFHVLRAASERVTVPSRFASGNLPAQIDALDAEAAFITANPGLAGDGIAIACERGMLREVRICMTPSLTFRACGEVDRGGCRLDNLEVPEPG